MSTIAILMSTYNGEKFLDKQLESISGQKCNHDIKLFIRDDGSQDRTINIVDKWKEKIDICFRQGSNIGPALSFWSLFVDKAIKADYYAFCDQDDIWDADKLQVAIAHLEKEAHLYACNCRSIDAGDNILEEQRKKQKPDISAEKLFVSGVTQGCAMVFTAKLREFICSKNISCVPMHDLIICLYALHFGGLIWDQEPHFSYRFHENNVIANKRRGTLAYRAETLKRWNKSQGMSMAKVADELLRNVDIEDKEERVFLEAIKKYKFSLQSKIWLWNCRSLKSCDRNALNSFYARLALNKL